MKKDKVYKRNFKRITFEVTQAQQTDIKKAAADKGLSIKGFLNHIIKFYVKHRRLDKQEEGILINKEEE